MKIFLELLQLQDSFASHFTILFKGQRKMHSNLGVFLSLLINFACCAMFITLLFQLINHSLPVVTMAQLNSPLSTNITWNSKDMLFTIGLRDKAMQTITDPAIARLVPIYEVTVSANNTLIKTEEELERMNFTEIYPFFEELGIGNRFNTTGLKDYNCFKGKDNKEIVLGGKHGTEFYGNLAFFVKKCVNSTENPVVCRPEEEINEIIQGGWLQISYGSSFIDFNNFTTPIQYITEEFYTNLDVKLNKIVFNYFMPIYFSSENNIIFSNSNIERSFKSDKSSTDINLAKEDGVIYTVYVCPSFNIEKFYRRYVKIQEIGASTGGFWSGLSIVGIILLTFPQIQDFHMKVANSLFEFTSDKRPTKQQFLFVPKKAKKVTSKSQDFSRKSFRIDLGIINELKLYVFKCGGRAREMKKEYKLIYNEIVKYIDFTKASHIFHDVESIKSLLINKRLSSGFVKEKRVYDITPDRNKSSLASMPTLNYRSTSKNDQSTRLMDKKTMINTLIKAPSLLSYHKKE